MHIQGSFQVTKRS